MTLTLGAKITYLDGKEVINKKETKMVDFFYGNRDSGFWEDFIIISLC